MDLRRLLKPQKRVLVTGGAGYVGSLVVRRLLRAGYRVRILDAFRFGDRSTEELVGDPDFEIRCGDIRDHDAVVRALDRVDFVIHLAALVGDRACAEDPGVTVETNYSATLMLTRLSKTCGVTRLIFASTCSVYGQAAFADESTRPKPISLYATTKLDAESQVLAANEAHFHTTVLRLGTLFGLSPRPRFDLVANLLAAQAVTVGKIRIDGQYRERPFVHVDDAARAFVKALNAPPKDVSGEVLCVGGSELNVQLSELADRIHEILPDVVVERRVVDDRRSYHVDFTKIERLLGFSPNRSLRSGIAEIIAAISSGEIVDYRDPLFHNSKIAEDSPERITRPLPVVGVAVAD